MDREGDSLRKDLEDMKVNGRIKYEGEAHMDVGFKVLEKWKMVLEALQEQKTWSMKAELTRAGTQGHAGSQRGQKAGNR